MWTVGLEWRGEGTVLQIVLCSTNTYHATSDDDEDDVPEERRRCGERVFVARAHIEAAAAQETEVGEA